jgi:DNA-binding transcriptional LysR family regulator
MELRHLRYFCAVAEEMHVTRAARRLHVAQPALTQQIKALEAELRTPLLRRVGRGIELTEAGAAFWREAQSILKQVHSATLIAQEAARGVSRRLVIGLTETVSFAPAVTAVLKHARKRWPQVEFSLIQTRSVEAVLALVERRVDVAFMRSPEPDIPTLETRPFLTEGFVVAAHSTHPLAKQRSIELSALVGQALILPSPRTANSVGLRTKLIAAFASLGVEPQIVQETPEYVVAINLAAAGLGLAIVPSVMSGLRREGVVYLPLRSTPPLLTEIIVVSRKGDTSPIADDFLALVGELTPPLSHPGSRRPADTNPDEAAASASRRPPLTLAAKN